MYRRVCLLVHSFSRVFLFFLRRDMRSKYLFIERGSRNINDSSNEIDLKYLLTTVVCACLCLEQFVYLIAADMSCSCFRFYANSRNYSSVSLSQNSRGFSLVSRFWKFSAYLLRVLLTQPVYGTQANGSHHRALPILFDYGT